RYCTLNWEVAPHRSYPCRFTEHIVSYPPSRRPTVYRQFAFCCCFLSYFLQLAAHCRLVCLDCGLSIQRLTFRIQECKILRRQLNLRLAAHYWSYLYD
ncbi:hypothetical protein ASPFODRAFT_199071, partial [Aspergillus luchuensis CBS 106.47]